MKTIKKPKLTLVGAGPGDPELITLKGVKALREADVILYDALVDKKLLKHAPQAIKVFVGKRKGNHIYSQDEINELIVQHALNYGHVVRLKGGDPFIFGRGTEEIAYAETFNIQTAVVPGISSSSAVPASQGIPLTLRNVAESFWVVTGTTSENKISADLKLAARSSATVVILMGMGKLRSIVTLFQKYGKGETPVAIIQNGTTAYEKLALGTVNSIVEVSERKGLDSPAIIVVGEVVRHSHQLRSFYEEIAGSELVTKKKSI